MCTIYHEGRMSYSDYLLRSTAVQPVCLPTYLGPRAAPDCRPAPSPVPRPHLQWRTLLLPLPARLSRCCCCCCCYYYYCCSLTKDPCLAARPHRPRPRRRSDPWDRHRYRYCLPPPRHQQDHSMHHCCSLVGYSNGENCRVGLARQNPPAKTPNRVR